MHSGGREAESQPNALQEWKLIFVAAEAAQNTHKREVFVLESSDPDLKAHIKTQQFYDPDLSFSIGRLLKLVFSKSHGSIGRLLGLVVSKSHVCYLLGGAG